MVRSPHHRIGTTFNGLARRYRLLQSLLTPITDAFIAVAESHREYLRDVEHLPQNKIFVVHNGIDTQRFSPDRFARAKVRKELGIADNTPVVGIVAALRPEKDHLLFVAAANRILQREPGTKFLIIGEGAERTAIEGEIERLGLRESIILLGKSLRQPNVT